MAARSVGGKALFRVDYRETQTGALLQRGPAGGGAIVGPAMFWLSWRFLRPGMRSFREGFEKRRDGSLGLHGRHLSLSLCLVGVTANTSGAIALTSRRRELDDIGIVARPRLDRGTICTPGREDKPPTAGRKRLFILAASYGRG